MILNVGGRPSTSIFGNGGLLGTGIDRANALGLNRDPSEWQLPAVERQARINIWWLLVIQDRWSSLANGTLMQINRRQFDVPVPDIAKLAQDQTTSQPNRSALIFVALLTLTEVLGRALEHVHDLNSAESGAEETCVKSSATLFEAWEISQNDGVRGIIFRGRDLDVSGAGNLRLAYLGVQFLLRRWQLNVVRKASQPRQEDATSLRTSARRTAEEIYYFVSELEQNHFNGFWLPMHAYTLTSTSSFLVRDALHPGNMYQATSHQLLIKLTKVLRTSLDQFGWELAENAVNAYGHVADKLELADQTHHLSDIEFDPVSCLSLPGMEQFFVNIDEYLEIEPEDHLHDFSFLNDDFSTLTNAQAEVSRLPLVARIAWRLIYLWRGVILQSGTNALKLQIQLDAFCKVHRHVSNESLWLLRYMRLSRTLLIPGPATSA